MSKLANRIVKNKVFLLGDVEINTKPVPFGKILEFKKEIQELEKQGDENAQLEYVKKVLVEFTDLEAEDVGSADYALTQDEAYDLFMFIMAENSNPKASGLVGK